MAFDSYLMETDRVLFYKGVEYQVITTSDSGLLIVAQKDDVKNKNYPLQLVAIPDIYDSEFKD